MEFTVNNDLALANAESLRTPEKCNPAVANVAEILRPLDTAVIGIIIDQIRPYLSGTGTGDGKAGAASRIREHVIALNDVRSTLGLPALKCLSRSGVSTVIDAILTAAASWVPRTCPKGTKKAKGRTMPVQDVIATTITVLGKDLRKVTFTHFSLEPERNLLNALRDVNLPKTAEFVRPASRPLPRADIERLFSRVHDLPIKT